MIETEKKQSWEFLYINGAKHIRCLVCGTTSPNQLYIDSLWCTMCQKYHPMKSENNFKSKAEVDLATPKVNGSSGNSESPQKSETNSKQNVIYCDRCLQQMTPTFKDSHYYMCPSGHQSYIGNLIPVEPKKPEKKKRRIELTCKFCGKVAEVVSENKFGKDKKIRKYTCGHSEFIDLLAPPDGRDALWNKAFPFQQEGIEFLENSNYTALLADEMGLGKTMQSLMAYRYNYDELMPCLIVCEAAKVYDWQIEFNDWVIKENKREFQINDEPLIHTSGQYGLCPGFRNHIISMALLQKPKVLQSIIDYGFKFVIIDESHSFKNEDSKRTAALQKICKNIPHYVFLSGTPVMNKVEEFFTTLNILRPSHFPSKSALLNKCDRDMNGKVLGISKHYQERFFKMTSEYIIRRTKKNVGIQLPELFIHSKFIEVNDNSELVTAYNKGLDKLEEILNEKKSSMIQDILGIFANLRHITGLMKIQTIAAYVREFMESTEEDNAKICVGVHHKLVGEFLMKSLSEYNPITISDEDGLTKANRIDQFKLPQNRLLIASILGAGQGLNIQFCKNFVQAEREWNPAKEEQFYGRFHRIVKDADGNVVTEFTEEDSVIGDVLNAKDTLDEYFDAAVKLKKQIVKTTEDRDFAIDSSFMMELARQMVNSRMKLGIG